MTHFSDDLYLGAALVPSSVGSLSSGSINNPSGRGVGPLARMHGFDVVPAAAATNNIAAAQVTAGAGNLVLTAGAGVTQTTYKGATAYRFDTPRAPSVTSTANISGVNVTITGYDLYGQSMTETRAGPNITTINFQKAFYYITNVAVNGAVANISVGSSNILGVPYRITDRGYVVHAGWDNLLADNAGTLVVADTTSPATATTGDTRGTYLPAGNTPDGVRRLVLAFILPSIASGPNATTTGAIGVTQA